MYIVNEVKERSRIHNAKNDLGEAVIRCAFYGLDEAQVIDLVRQSYAEYLRDYEAMLREEGREGDET